MNPRFGVNKASEAPKPTLEETPSKPEAPVAEQPTPPSEEAREDETKAVATSPEMVIEEPPRVEASSQEPSPAPQVPKQTRVFETDITKQDIDVEGAADLQERISGANQP